MKNQNSYLSLLIKNARIKRIFSMLQVYSGICSEAAYARFEGGDFDVNIHVRGAVMQRLGINETRGGMCINAREYEELDDREHLLENIGMREYGAANKRLEEYKNKFNMKNHLNRQFIDYVEARLKCISGNKKKSLELYEQAIRYTMPDYDKKENIACISVYEAYIVCEIAALSAELGNVERGKKLYMKLIKICKESNMDRWIIGRIYPKAVCGILRITKIEEKDADTCNFFWEICDGAIECLRQTGRLYFLRELLTDYNVLCTRTGQTVQKEYNELLACLNDLYEQYNICEHDYEWYPYYINGIFYPVDKVINERRKVYGMTVEELAGTELDVGTVSRIINGKNMPRRNTIDILFKKLGMEGVQYSDKVVSKNVHANELWDVFVDALTCGNIDLCEEIYCKWTNMLDMGIYVNKTVVDWMRIKLDVFEEKLTYDEALRRYRENFEKIIVSSDKIMYRAVVEDEIIGNYIDCMSNIEKEECVQILGIMYDKIPKDIVERKRNIMFIEGMLRRFSNYSGNCGEYEKSNRLAKEGIELELSCSRACVLGTLFYSMAWNNAQVGTISQEDIKMCKYSYLFAWFIRENVLRDFYYNKAKEYECRYNKSIHE